MSLFNLSGKITFGVDMIAAQKGEEKRIVTSQSNIFFILTGEIEFFFSDNESKTVREGEMVFLPPAIDCYCSIHQNTETLHLRIGDLPALCYHFFPAGIIPEKEVESTLFYPLGFKSQLLRWLISMKEYIQDGKFDQSLTEIKTFELFYILKCCYASDEIGQFFAPAMHEDYKFSLFVLRHYSSVKTAEELARLSNYSFSAFEKQFRKVFGMAPYRWMLQRKVNKVYREIYETSTPLKVIADELGFSGLSQLSDFCRKHFGISPIAIRNKRKNK